jgi:hypothetical protein
MERIEKYYPVVGEICIYMGMTTSLRGQLVICDGHKSKTSVWIKGYNTGTRWDNQKWGCVTTFLSKYQMPTPDWEV